MSIRNTFETARLALAAQSAALNNAGQNVANAGVDGYSRRRLTLQTLPQHTTGMWSRPYGQAQFAPGVGIEGVQRMRDELMEGAARDARAGLGGADEQYRSLSALEGLMGTGQGGTLADVLGQFWNSFSDLANSPTDVGVRRAVMGRATALADTLRGMDDGLKHLSSGLTTDLGDGVGEMNKLLSGIAQLNTTIRRADATGTPDLEAQDRRDQLVDQLSELAPIRIQRDNKTGDYSVVLGGHALVSAGTATHLELNTPVGATPFLTLKGGQTQVAFEDGRVGARLTMLTTTLPGVQTELDAMAADLVGALNGQHTQGTDLDGNPGGDFFDPLGTTARTLRLAITDPRQLAAAGAGLPAGDSTNALALVNLRAPFEQRGISLLSGIGANAQAAEGEALRLDAVTRHMDALAEGVSGVSLDEEMTRLIEHQQAYQAAARVLTTAQDMMDILLAL